MVPIPTAWHGRVSLAIRRFTCGYCGFETGTQTGFRTESNPVHTIHMCGSCNRPTYFEPAQSGEADQQMPPPKVGKTVQHVPADVAAFYDEVRKATSAGAYTAAVTVARTLLAKVAVNLTAPVGESFLFYVNWLETKGFTTAPMKPWVDHVRAQANISAHELKLMDLAEGTRSLAFVEMLLRIVYEFPGNVPPPP